MKRFLAVPKVARALGSLIGSPVVGSCVPEHQLNWRYGNAALEEVGWDAGVCGGQVPAQHMQLVSFPPLPRPPRFSARLRLPAGQGPTAQVGLVRVMVLVPPLKVTGAVGKWVAGSMFPPAAQFSEAGIRRRCGGNLYNALTSLRRACTTTMNKPTALPSPNQSSEPVLYGYTPEPPALPAVPLSHYLWLLRRHRWKVLAFIALCVTAALAISTRLTRIYESTVTVDIDRQMPSVVVGENATPVLANDADQFLATQVKLIQSDGVLRPVVQQYHLLDLKKGGPDSTPETAMAAAPILLKNLKVTRSPNTYLLLISYRSPEPHLAADVANDIARSYVERTYDLRIRSSASLASFMEKQLDELKAKMEIGRAH